MAGPLLDDLSGLYDKEQAYARASILQRGFAYLLDSVIISILVQASIGFFVIELDAFRFLFQPVVLLVYCCLLESSSMRGTVGKRVVGIQVISEEGALESDQIIRRNFLKVLLSWMPIVMLILLNIDKEKRGPHDRWANMLVVVRNKKEDEQKTI